MDKGIFGKILPFNKSNGKGKAASAPAAPGAPAAKASPAATAPDYNAGFFSKVSDFLRNKPLLVVLGLIVTIVLGIIVAWYVYYLIKTKALERKSFILDETRTPVLGTILTNCNGDGMPTSANGKRFTLTFWIYIHNLDKNSGVLRHVLHRGDEKNSRDGSPAVFLDANSNKLHVLFSTTSKALDEPDDLAGKPEELKLLYAVAKRGITIDYIPMQRWVHVGIVVNESANGGSIASYVDGELVKTTSTNQIITVGPYKVSPKINNLALDRRGNVFIGGTSDSASGIGFSGLVSMVQFFNYDLNSRDVYKNYTLGPLHQNTIEKVTSTIGMDQYGVRNPIYTKNRVELS